MGSRGTETTGALRLTVQVVVTAAAANTWQGAPARAAQTWTSPYLSTLEYLGPHAHFTVKEPLVLSIKGTYYGA